MLNGRRQKELAAKGRYWCDHVAAWSASGLSQAEYCRRCGLANHNLGYWVKKLGARRSVDIPEAVSAVELVEVGYREAGDVALDPLPLRVAVGNRFQIEVGGDFDVAVFEKLALSLVRISDSLA